MVLHTLSVEAAQGDTLYINRETTSALEHTFAVGTRFDVLKVIDKLKDTFRFGVVREGPGSAGTLCVRSLTADEAVPAQLTEQQRAAAKMLAARERSKVPENEPPVKWPRPANPPPHDKL